MKKRVIVLGICISMLMGSCQGLSKVSELEEVTVVAEPQITENNSSVPQENSIESELSAYSCETEDNQNDTEDVSLTEMPLEIQTFEGTDNIEEDADVSVETTTIPYGSEETFSGFYTIDGISLPITYTVGIENIVRGSEAYLEMQNNNSDVPVPSAGKEYIIFTVCFSYNTGEPDEITLMENIASLQSLSFYFALLGETENAENMTSYLNDSIYNRTIKKGESISGKVAFLYNENGEGPLVFVGYGNSVNLSIA